MTREYVEHRNRETPLRAAARWTALAAPSRAVRSLGASVLMLLAGALRHLATLLNGSNARLPLLPRFTSTSRASCAPGLFTDACPLVAHAVGVSCEAAPEVPASSNGSAELPESLLEGPPTEPSPPAHSVRPSEAAVDVGDLEAETLRSSGVAEVQRLITLAPERGATASARTVATLGLESSAGRTRLLCNPPASTPGAMTGACLGAGR